jgi:hypothetical protein
MNQHTTGTTRPTGDLLARVERDLGDLAARPLQRLGLAYRLRNFVAHRYREIPASVAMAILGRVSGVLTLKSQMVGQVFRVDWSKLAPWQALKLQELLREHVAFDQLPALFGGQVLNLGVLSRRVVTDTGVGYIVDAFANTTELENMKYHGLGTGGAAEAAGNTALTTEITANHYTGSVRPTGTTEEGASANIYKTIATHTQATAGDSITEHGVFSATSAGVMIDRHLFTAVALAVGDSFSCTYSLSLASGG